MSRKTKFNIFSLEILDYQDTDARERNNDFLIEYSSTSAVVLVEILMENGKLVVVEK